MRPMYLRDVEINESNSPPGQMIQMMRAAGQPVPQIMHMFAFKPEATAHLNLFTQAVMRGPSPLAPGMRELIAAFTSQANRCPF